MSEQYRQLAMTQLRYHTTLLHFWLHRGDEAHVREAARLAARAAQFLLLHFSEHSSTKVLINLGKRKVTL